VEEELENAAATEQIQEEFEQAAVVEQWERNLKMSCQLRWKRLNEMQQLKVL
jgi:hypothetical protein